MSFYFLIICLILSVMGVLATLILCIIAFATGKQRNGLIYGVVFVMSLVLAVLSFMEMVERGKNKMKQGIAWIKERDTLYTESDSYDDFDSSKDYYACIPDSIPSDAVPSEFFYDLSGRDYYIPLVYPYRFVSSGLLDNAWIETLIDRKDACSSDIREIHAFAFDNRYLLVKRDNSNFKNAEDLPEYSYFIFDFKTGKCDKAENEIDLFRKAEMQGYLGKKYLSSIKEHYGQYEEITNE